MNHPADKVKGGRQRATFIGTYELHRLDHLAALIHRAFGEYPYLVGSANAKADYRDVDVRLMLPDKTFDALFLDRTQKAHERGQVWSLVCYAITAWLRAETGLPIDFQIQRTTEANKKYGNQFRNPLGMARTFAGLGDATNLQPRDKKMKAAYLKRTRT